jgi:hypothetical protein
MPKRGDKELKKGRKSLDRGLTISCNTHCLVVWPSFILSVHETAQETRSITAAAKHLSLPSAQPANSSGLEAAVKMVHRIQSVSLTL